LNLPSFGIARRHEYVYPEVCLSRGRDPRFSGAMANQDLNNGNSMDDSVQKSCWGVTAKAVIGFAGIILLAWLVGGAGAEGVATIAAR
jgi:hypothetical protein